MNAPTKAELQAYSRGELDPQRRREVECYVTEHPDCLADVESAPDDEVVRHLRGTGEVPAPERRRSLLDLAVEAILPVVAGCAGALAGGVEGGLAGVVAGQAAEKAINLFGGRIVHRWLHWLRRQPPVAQTAALTALADVPSEEARSQASARLLELVPQASDADRRAAADYLGAIPRTVRQSLLSDRAGGRALLPAVSVEDSMSLLRLLPASLPPYAAPCLLPGTTYQLEELIGSGGFGAVYRASMRSERYLHRAIKFCLDRSLVEVLRKEKDNLERLIAAGGQAWSPRIVRLYGYDLDHETPYLVYEYVPGGDLVQWLARRARLTPAEVLALVVQVTEALAFAHERGIVHRDLKPANVLVEDDRGKVKLADFGIGGVAQRVAQTSRVGTVSPAALSAAEQASLFRGAGTPLYADPEQREGKAPDPRHDLHSLGVMWYQLLVGDVTREMPKGWARELERRYSTPREHVELIERCVGWIEERPGNAGELLPLLRHLGSQVGPGDARQTPGTELPTTPSPGPATRQTEAQAWAEAQNANTPEALDEFLQKWPTGAKAEEARGCQAMRLREDLLKNLTDADLRRRYLSIRTEKQRQLDLAPSEDAQGAFGGVGCFLIIGLIVAGINWPLAKWVGLAETPNAVIVAVLAIAVVAVLWLIGWLWKSEMNRIAGELGPLPPDTPRDLDAARRYLLGDDKPA